MLAKAIPAGLPSKAQPGFEHVRRYQDSQGIVIAKLLPGDFYVTNEDEILDTILGSCVSACIRSPRLKLGGMNHFMLPSPRKGGADSWDNVGSVTRYGTASMDQLISRILKEGARHCDLEVKIFGGAQVLAGLTDVGEHNVAFVREFLRRQGLAIVAEDTGGTYPRHIRYSPVSGRVQVRHLKNSETITSRELAYQAGLSLVSMAGSIDLS